MPAAKVRADHDALRQIAQQFNANAQTVERTTQKLKSNLETLRGGDWAGRGADKFYAEMESSVLPTYRRLSKALCSASNLTLKIDKIMQQAEDDATALFRGGEAGSNGAGAREKGGVVASSTGAVIGTIAGGLVGSIFGLPGLVVGGWVGNKVGDAVGDGLQGAGPQTPAEVERDLSLRRVYQDTEREGLTQTEKDAATVAAARETARQYNIDISGFKEIHYDKNLRLDAQVTPDGIMTLGPSSFTSPGYLASTLGHEGIHIQQRNDQRLIDTGQGIAMNEVEAYSWELDHARDNALTDGEIATITRRRQTHYDRLSDDNQDRADEHNYTPI